MPGRLRAAPLIPGFRQLPLDAHPECSLCITAKVSARSSWRAPIDAYFVPASTVARQED
jgi:hypothetical protein